MVKPLAAEVIDASASSTLERYGFREETFNRLRTAYLNGSFASEANIVRGEIEAPHLIDVHHMSLPDDRSYERLVRLGEGALARTEVGLCVLNGGMATRFGGGVKGCIEVFDGRSFLELKLRDAARWGAPVLLMNSFSTDAQTRTLLTLHDSFGADVTIVEQGVSIRLDPDGSLFRVDDRVSLYTPGHGDLVAGLSHGALTRFLDTGVKYLLVTNVDNVLATLDPAVIGAHIEAVSSGSKLSIEVVESRPDDPTGGKPVRVDGSLRIVESFRFPHSFDPRSVPVHNTATLFIDTEALRRSFDLDWYIVRRTVDDRTAIQFERLIGDISAFLPSKLLLVPRDGSESRFGPVKSRDDLEQRRALIRSVCHDRSIVPKNDPLNEQG